jgi:hypothetical protein
MSILRLIAIVLIALTMVHPATAWNAAGHRVIAYIAYQRLTPKARARADHLLRNHPDLARIFDGSPEGAREAFLAAAEWPDTIRHDPRFFDDTRRNARPTALLPGFPDMARHQDWHYDDQPLGFAGARIRPVAVPNALTEIQRLVRELAGTPSPGVNLSGVRLAYDLPWILHIGGDLHQPLHCVTRVSPDGRDDDHGGNRVFVSPGKNLHAFWDDVAGENTSTARIARLAAQVTGEFGTPRDLAQDPREWLHEGFEIALHDVYALGPQSGSRKQPIRLPLDYQRNAKHVARQRMALAGYRLAAVLNDKLK